MSVGKAAILFPNLFIQSFSTLNMGYPRAPLLHLYPSVTRMIWMFTPMVVLYRPIAVLIISCQRIYSS